MFTPPNSSFTPNAAPSTSEKVANNARCRATRHTDTVRERASRTRHEQEDQHSDAESGDHPERGDELRMRQRERGGEKRQASVLNDGQDPPVAHHPQFAPEQLREQRGGQQVIRSRQLIWRSGFREVRAESRGRAITISPSRSRTAACCRPARPRIIRPFAIDQRGHEHEHGKREKPPAIRPELSWSRPSASLPVPGEHVQLRGSRIGCRGSTGTGETARS